VQPLGTKVYLLKRYSPSDSFCTFFSESVLCMYNFCLWTVTVFSSLLWVEYSLLQPTLFWQALKEVCVEKHNYSIACNYWMCLAGSNIKNSFTSDHICSFLSVVPNCYRVPGSENVENPLVINSSLPRTSKHHLSL